MFPFWALKEMVVPNPPLFPSVPLGAVVLHVFQPHLHLHLLIWALVRYLLLCIGKNVVNSEQRWGTLRSARSILPIWSYSPRISRSVQCKVYTVRGGGEGLRSNSGTLASNRQNTATPPQKKNTTITSLCWSHITHLWCRWKGGKRQRRDGKDR